MKNSKAWLQYCRVSLVWGLIAVGGASAHGRGEKVSDAITVKQLLSLESTRLHKAPVGQPQERSEQRFTLLGIWGVGSDLVAQMRDRGRVIEFRQKDRRALQPVHSAYALVEIKPPCVYFMLHKKRMKRCL